MATDRALQSKRRIPWQWGLTVILLLTGCHSVPHRDRPAPYPVPPVGGDLPRELSKTVLPTYIIEPPDILVVEAISLVPKSPYYLRPGDVLRIDVQGTLPDAPIAGDYLVQVGGTVTLGGPYGSVKVAGMTVEQAQKAIDEHLRQILSEPFVTVSLSQIAGMQQITGEHLVGPDGTITLGTYGSVSVVGMTLEQAKRAIENHLSQYLDSPEVSVNVFSYNSKVYYIITQGAGLGDQVVRFPVTGNETVLDALSNINGLTEVSSKRIWIARPTPNSTEVQILPVDWEAITSLGATETNYQILPGDRIYIAEDKLVAWDNHLAKLLAPIERIMGFSILGVGTASRFSGKVLQNQGGGGFGGFGGF